MMGAELALRHVLEALANGRITVEEAEKAIRLLAIEELGKTIKLDVGRELRAGKPEVILAEGKGPSEVVEAAIRMAEARGRALISRLSEKHVKALEACLPEGFELEVREAARAAVVRKRGYRAPKTGGKVGIVTGGTSDMPVAEEAKLVAEEMGCEVIEVHDVGVAGLQRVLKAVKVMVEEDVDVIIVVAGREGALPSVVAGLVDVPVIGVPASGGYGVGSGGLSALLAMLQSCSLGLSVVNIDSGVQAGVVAALIANRAARFRSRAQGTP